MNNCWEIANKELAIYGVHMVDEEQCQVTQGGKTITLSIVSAISAFKKQADYHVSVFRFLWRELAALLHPKELDSTYDLASTDARLVDLFIASMSDLGKMIDMFEECDNTSLKRIVLDHLARDVLEFDSQQIKVLSDFKISIDWTFRSINKYGYIVDLLRFISGGPVYVNSFDVKTAGISAKGVGGPWGNLDLPMLERMWPYKDEEGNLIGRIKDIRKQRRYRQGFENYNGDGNVGEGFYWRELRNEPYSWYDRASEEPYYSRYLLSR